MSGEIFEVAKPYLDCNSETLVYTVDYIEDAPFLSPTDIGYPFYSVSVDLNESGASWDPMYI